MPLSFIPTVIKNEWHLYILCLCECYLPDHEQTPGLNELQSAVDKAQEADLNSKAKEVSCISIRQGHLKELTWLLL